MPIGLGTAALIGGGLAAAGTVAGGLISSGAQKSAAKTAATAQQASDAQQLALTQSIYNQNTANEQPYLQSGYGAQSVVNQLLGLHPMTAAQFNSGQTYIPGTTQQSAPAPAPTPSYVPPTTYGGSYGQPVYQGAPKFGGGSFYKGFLYNADNQPDDAPLAKYNASAGGPYSFPTPIAPTPVNDPAAAAAAATSTTAPATPSLTDIIRQTPGYQFQEQQSLAGINSNAYARNIGNSGATYKALEGYSQNLADNYYQQYLNNVMGVAAGGASAAGALAGVSQNYLNTANQISQNGANSAAATAAANANAAGTLGTSIAGGLGIIGNTIPNLFGSSYHAPSYAPASGYTVNSGTSNYFNNNPFGGSGY